jgi:hypothetical protein
LSGTVSPAAEGAGVEAFPLAEAAAACAGMEAKPKAEAAKRRRPRGRNIMGKKRGYDRQDDNHANWVLTSPASRPRAESDSQFTLR